MKTATALYSMVLRYLKKLTCNCLAFLLSTGPVAAGYLLHAVISSKNCSIWTGDSGCEFSWGWGNTTGTEVFPSRRCINGAPELAIFKPQCQGLLVDVAVRGDDRGHVRISRVSPVAGGWNADWLTCAVDPLGTVP